MPDIYMHSRLASDLREELNEETDRLSVALGATGPDPMYFHIFSKHKSRYYSYANSLHDQDTKGYLKEMTRYVKNNYNIKTYSFLVGFISHYALDVIVHPYIYYNVGIYNEDDPKTFEYKGLHLRFERTIDAILIKRELHCNPSRVNLTKVCHLTKESPKEINDLMGQILNKRFKIEDGSTIYSSSVKAMYNVVNYLNTDRTGIKKQLYKIIDLCKKSGSLYLKDLSLFNRQYSFDFLNEEQLTWHHPITNKQYNSQVIELYDQAKNFAFELITKVDMYLSGNKDIDLNKVFTNLSLNSGIDCDHDKPFQYFDNYSKKAT